MKRLLLCTSLAILALSSPAAFADSGHKHHGKNEKHQKHHKHHKNEKHGKHHARHDVRHERRHDRHDRHDHRDTHHDNGRHLGWENQAFRRGERVPAMYLQPQYYVQDHRTYRLAPPPRGYRWVRPADDRYLLVQTTTGLISQLLGY